MELIIRLIVSSLAVYVAANVVPGVTVDGFMTAVVVAIILGVVNYLVKPLLVFLTLPITIVTLGLFLLVINAVLVLLAAAFVDGFHVQGLMAAMWFSIVMSVVHWIIYRVFIR